MRGACDVHGLAVGRPPHVHAMPLPLLLPSALHAAPAHLGQQGERVIGPEE